MLGIPPHVLRKLVRVSALKQLAERIKLLYYDKEEIDAMITQNELHWEAFNEDEKSSEDP